VLFLILSTFVFADEPELGDPFSANGIKCMIYGNGTLSTENVEPRSEIQETRFGRILSAASVGESTCSVSCFDDSKLLSDGKGLLHRLCFPENEYYSLMVLPSTKDNAFWHDPRFDLPGCTAQGDDFGIHKCTLPPSFSGDTAETFNQKCAGVVKPTKAGTGDIGDMESAILDVWKDNICCGNDNASDLGLISSNEACLLPDRNFDSLPDPERYDGEEWLWSSATNNKYHIYSVNNFKNDIISNGEEWFLCTSNGDNVPSGIAVSSTLSNFEQPSSATEEPVIEYVNEGFTFLPETTLNIENRNKVSTDIFLIPYKQEFEQVELLDLESINFENDELGLSIDQNYKKLQELGIVADKYVKVGDSVENKKSDSFMCSKQNNGSKFIECCGHDLANCVNDCNGDLPCERTRRQGELLSTIFDFNYDPTGTGRNQIGVFMFSDNYRTAPLRHTDSQVNFNIQDWRGYEHLEFYLAFARSSKLRLELKGKTIDNEILTFEVPNHVISFSENGQQPMTWHHIKIPLINFVGENGNLQELLTTDKEFTINEIIFKVNDDFNEEELNSVKLKSKNSKFANVYFVDRLFLSNNKNSYCGADYKWFDDLDNPVSGKTACLDTPGYMWTASPEDQITNACCGNEKGESFAGGTYAGCQNGVPILDNARYNTLLYKINGDEFSDICLRETCYVSIPEEYVTLDSEGKVTPIQITGASTMKISSVYKESIEIENGIETTNPNELIKFEYFPLNKIYTDKQFKECGAPNTGEDFCSVKGDYFCSYGDDKNKTIDAASQWSDDSSGTAIAIDRNTKNDLSSLDKIYFDLDEAQSRDKGCCPKESCWNGVYCVEGISEPLDYAKYDESYSSVPLNFNGKHSDAFSKYFGYNNESNDFSQYVCVKEEIGSTGSLDFEASWKPTYYKERWDNSTDYEPRGYCLEDTQCWNGISCVNDGWYTDKNSGSINNLDGDHFCEKGKWTTRTKVVANQLLDLAGTKYSIHCDELNKVVNSLEDVPGLEDYYNSVDKPMNNVCVLKYDKNDNGIFDVAAGVSLNDDIDTDGQILTKLNLDEELCSNVKNNGFKICNNNKKVWYDAELKTLIFSQHSEIKLQSTNLATLFTSFFKSPADAAVNFIRLFVRPINFGEEDISFVNEIKNFVRFYSAGNDKNKVFAALEQSVQKNENEIGEFLTVEYSGFNADVCDAVLKYDLQNDNVDFLCLPQEKNLKLNYNVFSYDMDAFENWLDMTAKLRLNSIEESGEEPKAVITSPIDGVSFAKDAEIYFEAEEDPNIQSYYWDFDTKEKVKGEQKGRKFSLTASNVYGDQDGYVDVTLLTITDLGEHKKTTSRICIFGDNNDENVCTPDSDRDGICDGENDGYLKECPDLSKQEILIKDGGCKCNAGPDNCPRTKNFDQTNSDEDFEPEDGVPGVTLKGDVCDDDGDNDGVDEDLDKDDTNPLVCSDIDNDGCDDCGAGVIRVVNKNNLVANELDGGSEAWPDTDRDGLCDDPEDYPSATNTDKDDDNDGVLDINDKNKDGVDYSKDIYFCGDSDEDSCDDCSFLGRFDPDQDGVDFDGDGNCDSSGKSCVNVDGDGLGKRGTNITDCEYDTYFDENDDDYTICGDFDNDGCDDCGKGIGFSITDGKVSSEHEYHPDTDGDGLCDEPLDYFNPIYPDNDDDNDGVDDENDIDPLNKFVCGDFDLDTCDDCSVAGKKDVSNDGQDDDNDGICNLGESLEYSVSPGEFKLSTLSTNVQVTANKEVTCQHDFTDFEYDSTYAKLFNGVGKNLNTNIDFTELLQANVQAYCPKELDQPFKECVSMYLGEKEDCLALDGEGEQNQCLLLRAIRNNKVDQCKDLTLDDYKDKCTGYINDDSFCTQEHIDSADNKLISSNDCVLFDAITSGNEDLCNELEDEAVEANIASERDSLAGNNEIFLSGSNPNFIGFIEIIGHTDQYRIESTLVFEDEDRNKLTKLTISPILEKDVIGNQRIIFHSVQPGLNEKQDCLGYVNEYNARCLLYCPTISPELSYSVLCKTEDNQYQGDNSRDSSTGAWEHIKLLVDYDADVKEIFDEIADVGTGTRTLQFVPSKRSLGINAFPKSEFTIEPREVLIGQDVTFTSTSTDTDGDQLIHAWNFGDNVESNDVNNVHAYDNAGIYSVFLNVIDSKGAVSSFGDEVIVNHPNRAPTAIAGLDFNVYLGNKAEFNGGASTDPDEDDELSYTWKLNGEQIMEGVNPEYIFNTLGVKEIELTVTDKEGLSSTDIIKVTVDRKPNVLPTAVFSIKSSDLVSQSDIISEGIVVTGDKVVFINNPIEFDGTSSYDNDDGNIVAYNWNFPGDVILTTSKPTFTFNEVGTYPVTLTVTDDREGSNSKTLNVQVILRPNVMPVANTGGDKNIIVGKPFEFDGGSSTDSDGEIKTYKWVFDTELEGDKPNMQGKKVSYTYLDLGEYSASLTVTDDRGGEHTDNFVVTVTNTAPIIETNNIPTTVRPDEEITFDASRSSDSDGHTLYYSWNNEPGNSIKSYSFSTTGSKNVVLTVSDDWDEVTKTFTINVANTEPVASFNHDRSNKKLNQEITFDASSSSDSDGDTLKYKWKIGNNAETSYSENSEYKYTFTEFGSYPVKLTVYDGYVTSTTTQTLSFTNENPIPKFTYSPDINQKNKLTFDASSSSDGDGDTLNYKWKIGSNVETSYSEDSQYTYIFPEFNKDYLVTLTVADDYAEIPFTETVRINNREPTVNFEINGEQKLNNEIIFDASSSYDSDGDSITYEWKINDVKQSSTTNIMKKTFSVEGDYIIKLTLDDRYTTSFYSKSLDLKNIKPVAVLKEFVNTNKKNVDITFDASGSYDPDGDKSDLEYRWDFGDDTIKDFSSDPVAKHSYSEYKNEDYHAILSVRDKYDTSNEPFDVKIFNEPPEAKVIVKPVSTLTNEEIEFDATESFDPNGDSLTYIWNFGNGPLVETENPKIKRSYPTANYYYPKLTVRDEDGLLSETKRLPTLNIINRPPVAEITFEDEIHAEEFTDIDGSNSNDPDGIIKNYDWDVQSIKYSGEDQFKVEDYSFNLPEEVEVSLKVTDDKRAKTIKTSKVRILPPLNKKPVPIVGGDITVKLGTYVFNDGSSSYDVDGKIKSYKWDFGDNRIRSEPFFRHKYLIPKTYKVTLTVTDDDDAEASASYNVNVVSDYVPGENIGRNVWDVTTASTQNTCNGLNIFCKLGEELTGKPCDSVGSIVKHESQNYKCKSNQDVIHLKQDKYHLLTTSENFEVSNKFVNCGTISIYTYENNEKKTLNSLKSGQGFVVKTSNNCAYVVDSGKLEIKNLNDGWQFVPLRSLMNVDELNQNVCRNDVFKAYTAFDGYSSSHNPPFRLGTTDLLTKSNALTQYPNLGAVVHCGLTPEEKARRERLSKLTKEDGVLVDKKHDLTWTVAKEEKTCDFKYKYGGFGCYRRFVNYCYYLKLGGFTDWKIPTIDQAKTLIGIENTDNSLLDIKFSRRNRDYVWTSGVKSKTTSGKTYKYPYKFDLKRNLNYWVTNDRFSREYGQTVCVREGAITPTELYLQKVKLNNKGSIVVNEHTNNMFTTKREENKCGTSTSNFYGCTKRNYCGDSTLGGFTDWRNPNDGEVREIFDLYVKDNSLFGINGQDRIWTKGLQKNFRNNKRYPVNVDISSSKKSGGNAISVCVRDGNDLSLGNNQNSYTMGNTQNVLNDFENNLKWSTQDKEKECSDFKNVNGRTDMCVRNFETYCNDLNIGELTDWRLPTLDEAKKIKTIEYTNNELFKISDLDEVWLKDEYFSTYSKKEFSSKYNLTTDKKLFIGSRTNKKAKTLCVHENLETFSVEISAGKGGTITPASTSVKEKSSLSVDVKSNVGYEISEVKADDVKLPTAIGNNYKHTFNNIKSNKKISATFKRTKPGFEVNSGTGGKVFIIGDTNLVGNYYEGVEGLSYDLIIQPDPGYKISKLRIDGDSLSFSDSFYSKIFTDLDKVFEIYVEFVPDLSEVNYVSCSDSDGNNIFNKGEINYKYAYSTGDREESIIDSCYQNQDGHYAVEGYCDGNKFQNDFKKCSGICSNGKCVSDKLITLDPGWHLLGANKELSLEIFKDCRDYKIQLFDGQWYSFSAADNNKYIQKFGLKIPKGRGFWVLSKESCQINIPLNKDYQANNLPNGWNLINFGSLLDEDLITVNKKVCRNKQLKAWIYDNKNNIDVIASQEKFGKTRWSKINLGKESNMNSNINSHLGTWVLCG